MKKKLLAFLLGVLCLLSVVGCAKTPDEPQVTESNDYLTTISGTYVELFPVLSKAEYRDAWIDAVTPIVGEKDAEATTDMLLGMCMAEPYGPEAAAKYSENPDEMAFNCSFLGGVEKFVFDGHTIKGLDDKGNEVFSHSYKLLNIENENGFIFYQSEDENSSQFTYFAFSPDTMDSTYHLEFRYAEKQEDLQSWFEGDYAYWNAAAIEDGCDGETVKNAIKLFATENLSEAE